MKRHFLLNLMVFCLTVFTAQTQTITSFKFTTESLGWDEEEDDFEGVIDDENSIITFTTQRWIENITNLPAIFEVVCAEECENQYCDVKVGDDVQESGETVNDFRKAVVYTICGDVQYTIRFVTPQTTGIPVIKIETQDSVEITSKENWTNMTSFMLIDPNDDNNNLSLGSYNAIQYHRIRGRGNSTWTYPKKPYRIRFREDISLFGKAARENWVLLADYLDPTFLTTAVAFELGGSIFQLPFTCTYQHVNVYFNGRYDGLYTLTEHRQADPNGLPGAPGRVGIDQENGGWFIEMDNYYDEDPKFMTENYELPVMIKAPEYTPDPADSDNPFYDFIKNDLNELCDSLASPGFPENGYRDLIDMNTFIDFLMTNELVRNGELQFPKSTFAYKADQEGKISMGPLWDFDWAFAYNGTGHNYFTGFTGRLLRHDFFLRLFEDPIFAVKYKERWNEKYKEIAAMSDFIDNLGEKIRPAADEDAKRWIIPDGYQPDYDPDHAQQVGEMKKWWNSRVSWLNTDLNRVEVLPNSKDFGTITKDDDYPEITSQTFTLVTYSTTSNVTSWMSEGDSSAFELITTHIQVRGTGNGGSLTTISIKLKDGLQLGDYNDKLIVSGFNVGRFFTLEVPLSFAITKSKQELFLLDEVEDKKVGDANFFLTTTGGSGTGEVTFSLISGKAIVDEKTGEVKITGAGDIVVMATKAEDDDYQQAQSQELTIKVSDPTYSPQLSKPNPLRAWMRNGLLHVTGITPGETLSIYTITGILVYQRITTSDEMDIPLRAQGVYLVRVGNHTVKAVKYEPNIF